MLFIPVANTTRVRSGPERGLDRDAEGGHAVADVVTEKMGADVLQRKALGQ